MLSCEAGGASRAASSGQHAAGRSAFGAQAGRGPDRAAMIMFGLTAATLSGYYLKRMSRAGSLLRLPR